MLIFGGLMLNLVASGMLLRPINVRPVSNSKTAPVEKSPAISLKSSSEKESTKSCSNGSTHLSNGVAKFPSIPTAAQGDNEKEGSPCSQGPQDRPADSEQSKPILSGGESQQEAGQAKAADGSAELSGGMNGSTAAVSHPSTQGETTAVKAKLLDFSLLKDPFFCIYTWSLVFSQLAYFIPYFHLSARARNLDIDAMDASFIISVAGEARVAFVSHKTCNLIYRSVVQFYFRTLGVSGRVVGRALWAALQGADVGSSWF